jgi:hypothetical protein
MGFALKLLLVAQAAFWAWACWKMSVRARTVMGETSPPRPLSYAAGHWLLVVLLAAFAVRNLLRLLGVE